MAQALLLQSLRKFLDQPEGECWVWEHSKNGGGYGRTAAPGRSRVTHRVMYELFREPIPDGLDLDHLCRVRACCNPAHLEIVTRRQNVLRGIGIPAQHAAKTHCLHGHPLAAPNLRARQGRRECLECSRAYGRAGRARRRQDPAYREFLRESMRRWRSARWQKLRENHPEKYAGLLADWRDRARRRRQDPERNAATNARRRELARLRREAENNGQ